MIYNVYNNIVDK